MCSDGATLLAWHALSGAAVTRIEKRGRMGKHGCEVETGSGWARGSGPERVDVAARVGVGSKQQVGGLGSSKLPIE